MKGQTQIVSFVIATTIVVTSVAAAFTWGTPLLEERTAELEAQNMENDVKKLKESIDMVARSGEGASRVVEMDLSDGEIQLEPDEDRINIIFPTPDPVYSEEYVLLDGENSTRTKISEEDAYPREDLNKKGILAVRGQSENLLEFVIEYRTLIDETDTPKAEKVNLTEGFTTVSTGKTRVKVENIGSEQKIHTLDNGETMDMEVSFVRVDFE